jgi:hypothetical protein
MMVSALQLPATDAIQVRYEDMAYTMPCVTQQLVQWMPALKHLNSWENPPKGMKGGERNIPVSQYFRERPLQMLEKRHLWRPTLELMSDLYYIKDNASVTREPGGLWTCLYDEPAWKSRVAAPREVISLTG